MTDEVDRAGRGHLIRDDRQEDICFGLWRPSEGCARKSALLYRLILPQEGEREVHGNASFHPAFLERALGLAADEQAGLALLHSHPTPGWQDMSPDDVNAEKGNAGAVLGVTDLPFLGLTIGRDGAWSARFWERTAPRTYERRWCATVRVVGDRLSVTYMDRLAPPPRPIEELHRTISAWGEKAQDRLARLHVGIVGAGSVGAIIGEALARTGVETVTAIDFDHVETHNLDRLLHATRSDAASRRLKVDLLAEHLENHATAESFNFLPVASAVNEDEGYRRALDCDVLFSCVDRPWARHVLNYIAYAHLIPVVDGGIAVRRTKRARLLGADWRAHVATYGRRCLQCISQYDPGLVSAERDGLLDDPSYIDKLPSDHPLRRNENVFGFGLACASMQFLQMLAIVVAPMGISNPGEQLYHFVPGLMDEPSFGSCHPECLFPGLVACGDSTGLVVTGPRASPGR